jgi:hypothetical protein
VRPGAKLLELDDCDTLTVTSADGTEQVVTTTIQGADDGREHHEHSGHENGEAQDIQLAQNSTTYHMTHDLMV